MSHRSTKTPLTGARIEIEFVRAAGPIWSAGWERPRFRIVRRLDDRWGRVFGTRPGGKSGLHGKTVPGNARRGRPQRQCNRKQTAKLAGRAARLFRRAVRVKGCGKSAPRFRQRRRHCKPHREQDRIGVARRLVRQAVSSRHPGRSREAFGNECPRGMVIQRSSDRGQNPAYRPPDVYFIADGSIIVISTWLLEPASCPGA